jgi:hypothetical protein
VRRTGLQRRQEQLSACVDLYGERKSEGNEKQDPSTSRRIVILRVHECWQQVSETIECCRLEKMEDCRHYGAAAVWWTKYLGKTRLGHMFQRRRVRCRQRMAKVRLRMPLKNGGHAFGILLESIPGEPAWRLREEAAEYPNNEGARSEPEPPTPDLGLDRNSLLRTGGRLTPDRFR